jgi:hypothetical protein
VVALITIDQSLKTNFKFISANNLNKLYTDKIKTTVWLSSEIVINISLSLPQNEKNIKKTNRNKGRQPSGIINRSGLAVDVCNPLAFWGFFKWHQLDPYI